MIVFIHQSFYCITNHVWLAAFHDVLLLIALSCPSSDDPRKCQPHAECQTWALPYNAASGLPRCGCHGVAATRCKQDNYCRSIRWTGRPTSGT